MEQVTLELVEPPVVLDNPEDAHEGGPFVCCQAEYETTLGALGLHAASMNQPFRPWVPER